MEILWKKPEQAQGYRAYNSCFYLFHEAARRGGYFPLVFHEA